MKTPNDCYEEFLTKVQTHLAEKRGRASALARHLGCKRQHVSRWFTACRPCPGWVAIATLRWVEAREQENSNSRAIESLGAFNRAASALRGKAII